MGTIIYFCTIIVRACLAYGARFYSKVIQIEGDLLKVTMGVQLIFFF